MSTENYSDTNETYEKEIEELLADLGSETDLQKRIDELNHDLDLALQDSTEEFGGEEVITGTLIEVVPHDSEKKLGDITREFMKDGVQYAITFQRRPQCPSCEYVPTAEGDNITLTGNCSECGSKTCSGCMVYCVSCQNKKLCDDCSRGYSDEGSPLCPDCRNDKEQEVEFEGDLTLWRQTLEEEDVLLGHETERAIKFKEMALDAEFQRQQMEHEQEIESRKQELAELEAEREHIDRQQKRKLEQQKHELDAAMRKSEEKRKLARLTLDQEIERRQQQLEEYETVLEQQRKDAKQALKEREQRFKEKESKRDHKLDKEKLRKKHDREMQKIDVDREKMRRKDDREHRKLDIDAEDKRAKRDIEQQKTDIKRKNDKVENKIKKRKQKLAEWKAKNNGGGSSSSGKPPKTRTESSWKEMKKITEELEKMKEPQVIEVN